MKIGIFEIDHFEGTYPVIRLFDNGKNDITVFTNENVYRQFKFLLADRLDAYSWVIMRAGESKFSFIQRIYKETTFRKLELLYLNTISDNFIFYARMIKRLAKVRTVVTLHDVNTIFNSRASFGLRKFVRHLGKKQLANAVQEFNVVAMTMVDYVRSKIPSSKKVHCVPGAVFEEKNYHPIELVNQKIRIAVPGTLDRRRRDYEHVFEVLDFINERNLPIEVVLLGGWGYFEPEFGKRLIERCELYQKEHQNLFFYKTELVDQPEFDRVLNETHFIFIPSVINTTISDDVPEVYGLSKSSGNIFDVIKHARPFIVPTELNVEPLLKGSCFTYRRTSEIIDTLSVYLREPVKYAELRQAALEGSRNYTIEKVRQRNADLFL